MPETPPITTVDFDPAVAGIIRVVLQSIAPKDSEKGSYTFLATLESGEVQTRGCQAQVEATEDNFATDVSAWLNGEYELVPDQAAVWAVKLAGVLVVNGLSLKANRSARNDFIGQVVLIQTLISVGAAQWTDTDSVWDSNNVEHVMPLSDIVSLLAQYGIAWNTMFKEFAP